METDSEAVVRRPVVRRRLGPSPWQRRPRPRQAVASSWTSAAGQRVCRKYRRGRLDVGRLQQREYDKLRRIVPALSVVDTANQTRPRRVSKVRTVTATAKDWGGERGVFFPSLPPFPSFLFPSLFPRRIGPSSLANYLGRSAVGSPSG